ncbi:MAG: hypothetical protein ABIR96_05615 [Bdellovibrionota bacterium]
MSRSFILIFGLLCASTTLADASSSMLPRRKPASISKRPQIKISELMRQLDSSGQLDALDAIVKARIDELTPNPILRQALLGQWEEMRRKKDYATLDHFPMLHLKQVDRLRPALGGSGQPSEKIDIAILKGRLEDIFGECRELAPLPKAVSSRMPMMTNGHFPDPGLGLCDQDRSIKFARMLNSLMAANGSEIGIGPAKARSAQKLFELLIEGGHTVEMRSERTYANFLSLNWGDQPVIWPVWIDTGLKTREGNPIQVPVGHSQHSFTIDGPLVHASVMFYLGTDGVGFFGQVDERPAWTGMRASYKITSNDDAAKIIKALDYAGRYYRRIQSESQGVASGMAANGYGYLGVCNDSNAVLEWVDKGTVSVFPLMRAEELNQKSRGSDGLDEILRGLPKDSSDFPRTPSNLSRVLSMTPFEDLDDRDLHDESLRQILKSLESEVGR